jgi:prevent-host-death family protein
MAEKMSAAEFKNKCLKVMDRIKRTGREIVVTKRGKPVVRVLPAPLEEPEEDLEGVILHQDDDLLSTGETWEADS